MQIVMGRSVFALADDIKRFCRPSPRSPALQDWRASGGTGLPDMPHDPMRGNVVAGQCFKAQQGAGLKDKPGSCTTLPCRKQDIKGRGAGETGRGSGSGSNR